MGTAWIAGFCVAEGFLSDLNPWIVPRFVNSLAAAGCCRTESAALDFCGMFAGGCWWLFWNGVRDAA
ncbi:MAG: hypothetical protein JWN70_2556 [Planctomycetaceae bacterium]|nr:hypothetical protein [Planctomycetaceae bacterium]